MNHENYEMMIKEDKSVTVSEHSRRVTESEAFRLSIADSEGDKSK